MYKEKYLKYKNKYLFLKNLQGGSGNYGSSAADAGSSAADDGARASAADDGARASAADNGSSADDDGSRASAEYSSGLTYLLDNNNNVLILLERINEMIINSLQPQKNIPVSDKILINLFGLERKKDLSSLKNYIKIINKQHEIYKLNPESILNSSENHLVDIQNYNTHISRLCDITKINADDEKILKHLKDLKDLKHLKNLKDSKDLKHLIDLIDSKDLIDLKDLKHLKDLKDLKDLKNLKDLKDLIDLLDLKHLKCLIHSIKRIEGIDRQSLNNSKKQKIIEERQKIIDSYKLFSTFDETKVDECMKKVYEPPRVVSHNTQTPSKKTFTDPIMFDEHNIAEPHFVFDTNKDGEKQRILKDKDFLDTITNLINDRSNTELLINSNNTELLINRSNDNLVRDYNGLGCIVTAHNFKLSLSIKWPLELGKHCLVKSDDSDIFNFITKNKVSRLNKLETYNFVKDTILKKPYILLDDEYRYDFDERLEFNVFKFYKLINRRIYSLLEENQHKENDISCILCPNCKIYTTSDKTDILCYNCKESYCRKCIKKTHRLATCYEKPLSKEDEEKLDEICTACPGCKKLVERSEACIHMTCITCRTNFCHLCGEIWPAESFVHITDGLCSEVAKYPRLKEYIHILSSIGSVIYISKPQLRVLQKYPKLLEYLITSEKSIMRLNNTELEELKKDFSNSNSNSTAGGGGI